MARSRINRKRGRKDVQLQAGDLVCFSVQPDASRLPDGWAATVYVTQVIGFMPLAPHHCLTEHVCRDCGMKVQQLFDPARELLFLQRCTRH